MAIVTAMKKPSTSPLTRRNFLLASAVTAASVGVLTVKGDANPSAGTSPAKLADGQSRPKMQIAEMFSPAEEKLWRLMKQCGISQVVGVFPRNANRTAGEKPWSYASLKELKDAYE